MPTPASPDLWSGNVYITPVNSLGVATGDKIGCLEASLFTYQPSSESKSLTSKKHTNFGGAFGTVNLPSAPVVGINFYDSPDLIKAASVFGSVTPVSYSAASATADPTTAKLEGWVDLGRKNIDPLSFVLTNVGATTTYDIDDDYEFNPRLGMYRAITGGGITDAQSLETTWTSAAYDTSKIEAGTESQFRIRIDFDGKNQVTGDYVEITAPLLSIAPGAAIDFLGDDHTDYQFTGTAEAAASGEAPLTIETKV